MRQQLLLMTSKALPGDIQAENFLNFHNSGGIRSDPLLLEWRVRSLHGGWASFPIQLLLTELSSLKVESERNLKIAEIKIQVDGCSVLGSIGWPAHLTNLVTSLHQPATELLCGRQTWRQFLPLDACRPDINWLCTGPLYFLPVKWLFWWTREYLTGHEGLLSSSSWKFLISLGSYILYPEAIQCSKEYFWNKLMSHYKSSHLII